MIREPGCAWLGGRIVYKKHIRTRLFLEGRQLRRLLYSGRRNASSLLLMQNKTRNAVDAAVTPFDSALDCNVILPPPSSPRPGVSRPPPPSY